MSATDGAMVTAVVVDDEPLARAGIRRALAGCSWMRWVGEAASGSAAIELIHAVRPDVVFLDIEMPGGTGLEILPRLEHRALVVFTTAYAEHAVTAFELGALDYLLKPFGPERLASTLERIRAALGEPVEDVWERWSEVAVAGPISRLFVRTGRSVVPVAVDAVLHFEAWGDYVTAHTATARHVVHVPLHRLESRLDASRFVRVHRSHVVNLAHVTAFRSVDGATVAELTNGTRVPVSRAHARAVRRLAR